MNLHEYQAQSILRKAGVAVPKIAIASNMDEVEQAINELNLTDAVLKVQVHAGGRGKAGGVKFARGADDIRSKAKELIGMKIVNKQTGPDGVIAHKILLTPPVDIETEYYLGVVIDRENKCATVIASPEGGMEIEEVAAKNPEKILKIPIGLDGRLKTYQLVNLAKFMGWGDELLKQGVMMVTGLAKAFFDTDASLLEINPLVKTKQGELLALDAKLNIDSNALYRQKELSAMSDPTQRPANEVAAEKCDLAYIALDGNIGCMVNGAGLAMATMDIIQHYGGTPANFLDVGGGASKEKIAEGFKILLGDPNVKGILVNIFGGIMNCVTLAAGIITATDELDVNVPLVVRMEGTNVENGKQMLADSGLDIVIGTDLGDAAEKVVALSK